MRIALVVAIAKNGVIGDKGAMPWRISDDLKWFKKVTLGKPVIMGRKTFESIGEALPGRRNIVVTRSASWSEKGVVRAGGVEEALRLAEFFAAEDGADEACVIGGGEIYAQTIDAAHRIYLTRVEAAVEGDAYFPPFDEAMWRMTEAGGCKKDERNQYPCRFFILDRRKPHDERRFDADNAR